MNPKSPLSNSWFTAPIAILLLVATGCGLFIDGLYRDAPGLVAQAKGQDLVSLCVVLPALVITAILAKRGSAQAGFIWLGSLVYLVYTYASFAFAIQYNPLFLVYIALLGCSLYALIANLSSLDFFEVRGRYSHRTPARVVSVFLGVVAVLFYTFWLSELIPALAGGKVPESILADGTPTNAIHVLDMAWILPAFGISAVNLWRKQPLGYALAGILLPFFALLVSAILSMAILEAQVGSPDAVPMMAMFAILLVSAIGMLAWYWKGLSVPSGKRIEGIAYGSNNS